ncbi:hypothetical protein F1640_18305 [Novosphingobium sp. NBM11]|nr:hypothetical protein [Novosphingobium sp. NBM11]
MRKPALLPLAAMTLCALALTACGTTTRLAPLPTDLTSCDAEPVAPEIPAIDWSSIEAARASVGLRDRLTLDFILALRSAGGSCRSKVAGSAAWNARVSGVANK